MNESGERRPAAARAGERGGARLKFLLVMAAIAALVYVGAQFVPAAYRAWAFERFVQDAVNNAAVANKPNAWVEQQLRKGFKEHGVPEDATLKVAREGGHITATVRYTRPISLLVTEYEYTFDTNARSVTTIDGSL
ncbi:MAG TPA: hypothetical protein VK421_16820 [Pyrinomonadaceae bacterium]|nr:hypothetical protein [Pyrinomonadaceae bacterium]